jgi:hypothetical protein
MSSYSFASDTIGDFTSGSRRGGTAQPISSMPGKKQQSSTRAHRGVELDFATIAAGQLKVIIVTFTEWNMLSDGPQLFHVADTEGLMLYVIVCPKEYDHMDLEIKKLKFIYYPAMEAQRRKVMHEMCGPLEQFGVNESTGSMEEIQNGGVSVCTRVCMYVYACVCMLMYVCVCIYMCMHVYAC